MNKRFLCKLLALVLCAAMLLPLVPAASATNSHTAAEGVAWALARADESWCVDVDGKYGCQCVDLILAYYRYLVGYNVSGNANDYTWNDLPSGWVRTNTPSPGDVVVWGAGAQLGDYMWADSTYGHIGIVTAVGSYLSTVETNTYNSSAAKAFSNRYVHTPACYIHPDFAPESGTLDVNGRLDGKDVKDTSGYGTFDIYINGSLAGDDVSDYCNPALPAGTSYSITDIKATTGHIYNGSIGNLSGSVAAGQTVDPRLKFDTCTNHTYDSGTVTKAASCTQTGVKTYTCTKCKATKTETIPKLAHTPVVDPAVPATITTTGLTEGSHCSKCGTVLKAQQVVPKLPRVLNDFDLDGVAEPIMTLPGALTAIQDGAFEGGAAEVIIIPEGVTSIGSRAFANMPKLKIVFMPESVKTISFDAFDGSSNVKLYVQEGSKWGTRLDLPSVEIVSGWVDESKIPAGARVTEERWTYDYVVEGQTKKKKTTSPITEEGWTLEGTGWSSTSTGSQMCVDGYPGGYSGARNYTTDKWSSYENDTTKRTVSTSVSKYIYWHWCWISGYLSSENYNVYISDTPYEYDEAGRYYQYFSAFESADNAGHIDPNGRDGGASYYYWRGDPSDGSWWWFRIPVYQQTRVDYQKQYTYTMTIPSVSESRVSSTPVTESDTVRNVKHEVQYSFT